MHHLPAPRRRRLAYEPLECPRKRGFRIVADVLRDGGHRGIRIPKQSGSDLNAPVGAMFTPDHALPAREMLRVARDGGRIGLANWTPEGFIGQLFKVIGAYVPPPVGLKSPALWGTEPHIVALFGAQAADIRCARKHFNFRYRSAAHWIQVFREFYGPTLKAFAALDTTRQRLLEQDITTLLERFNVAGNTSLVMPSEYLEAVIVKR
jgi:hypothetical protein